MELKQSEILMARFCHDIIGPIGAINNGSEFFRDEFPETKSQAVDLIESSGKEAVARVQFYRQAYGALPEGAANFDEMKELVEKFFSATKVKVEWQPKEGMEISNLQKKLVLNLLILASGGLIKGGTVIITLGSNQIKLVAAGERAVLNEKLVEVLNGKGDKNTTDPKNVQAFYTVQVAAANKINIAVQSDKDVITFLIKT